MSTTEDDEFIYVEMSDEESLAHFGVKGMHWGVKKAGAIATAPARQGIKNAKTVGRGVQGIAKQGAKNVNGIGGAIGRANTARKAHNDAAAQAKLDKHGELGASYREAGKVLAAGALLTVAGRVAANSVGRNHPSTAIGIRAASGALQTTIAIRGLVKMHQIDKAANRTNAAAGNPRGTYVDRASKR